MTVPNCSLGSPQTCFIKSVMLVRPVGGLLPGFHKGSVEALVDGYANQWLCVDGLYDFHQK